MPSMSATLVDMSAPGDAKDAGQSSPVFASEAGPHGARPSTVFGAPDQEEMVARLDAVADDDLDSDFFAADVAHAEDAGSRLFDVGIRTLANEGEAVGTGPSASTAGTPFVGGGSAGALDTEADSRTAPVTPSGQRTDEGTVEGYDAEMIDFSDPDVRAAFVLGGPAAVVRRG